MIKLAFWVLVALDAVGILLLFFLGLAAAGSSRTSPLSVAFLLLVLPTVLLAAAIVLFVRASSPLLRGVAFLLAAAPLLIALSARALAEMQMRTFSNDEGTLTFFRAGPMRDIAEAIARNDARAVDSLLPRLDVNRAGLNGTTLLMSAMRQLRKTPEQHEVLRLLLAAGADPNKGADYELPLSIAIQVSGRAGAEPVRLLLDAGADPNLKGAFGDPVFFAATGQSASTEILSMLLDRGADVNAMERDGQTALLSAATTRNWRAARLLLERGADWKRGRSVNGTDFRTLIEGYAASGDHSEDLAEVLRHVREH